MPAGWSWRSAWLALPCTGGEWQRLSRPERSVSSPRRIGLGSEILTPKSLFPGQRLVRRAARACSIASALVALSGTARAQPARPLLPDPTLRAVASDSLRVYLMTMGQGDDLYELFGHD